MNTDILQPITDDSSLQAGRRFLRALWLDPVGGHYAAVVLGLSGRDFLGDGHSFVFTYACLCAELGRTPSMAEAVALSPAVCGELTYAILDEIQFLTDTRADALFDYGRELQRIADDRATAELRALVLAGLKEWSEFQRWRARGGWRAHQGPQGITRGNRNARTRNHTHRAYHDPSVRRGA